MFRTACHLTIFLASVTQAAAEPLVVAHRGLASAAPENTLACFRTCLALRIGFEFDIRRTKDGQLVCLHDDKLDRTTNAKGLLAERTFAEVRQLDAGSWFDPAFRGERVPTVEEIFGLIAKDGSDQTLIAVDLKETSGGLEAEVVTLAQKHGVLDRLLFIGLAIEQPEVRAKLRAASAKAQVACLAKEPAKLAEALADRDADWVYVRFLPAEAEVTKIHAAGKRLFIAGPLVAPLSRENWAAAAKLGFDGILTDFPLELKADRRKELVPTASPEH